MLLTLHYYSKTNFYYIIALSPSKYPQATPVPSAGNDWSLQIGVDRGAELWLANEGSREKEFVLLRDGMTAIYYVSHVPKYRH